MDFWLLKDDLKLCDFKLEKIYKNTTNPHGKFSINSLLLPLQNLKPKVSCQRQVSRTKNLQSSAWTKYDTSNGRDFDSKFEF